MSSITSHVLDTAAGRPAAGVAVQLHVLQGEGWQAVAEATTDGDGRVREWTPNAPFAPGTYRIRFATGDYFASRDAPGFHPWADVVFRVDEPHAHYHVPLLVSPFGYTTYRGS